MWLCNDEIDFRFTKKETIFLGVEETVMKRILLKLSGEFLQGSDSLWDKDKVSIIVDQIKRLVEEKFEIGIVIGGGNIFRGGKNGFEFDRCEADGIGMASTCVNALFLKACLRKSAVPCYITGVFLNGPSVDVMDVESARHALCEGKIVIFSGGTGHSYFSTDTAAALRALEIGADVLLKATKVGGVYDKDPIKFADAKRFSQLTYQQACEGNYGVMDACAFALCREQKMPIFIFNLNEKDAIYKAVHQKLEGTFIKE